MFNSKMYDLLDFGDGRRLERFGPWRLDRPCPAAEGIARSHPAAWAEADARFERTSATEGRWHATRELPDRWTIAHGSIQLELKRTEFGHLGVFPEHAATWDWIAARVPLKRGQNYLINSSDPFLAAAAAPRPVVVLNLFAYTGGSTLAAAAAGAEVVHVDAARNVVAWARRNAELSGLAGPDSRTAPEKGTGTFCAKHPSGLSGKMYLSPFPAGIRWIVEDAMKFARREVKRGNRYDAVILDPPSYGHGPHGEVWRLSKHLPRLLTLCGELTAGRRRFMLLTCHTPDFDALRLERLVHETWSGTHQGRVRTEPLVLRMASGRELPSGVAVYWEP